MPSKQSNRDEETRQSKSRSKKKSASGSRSSSSSRDGGSSGDSEQRASSRRGEREDDADLKAREYRDKDGNIHHHTRKYMEQHGGRSDADEGADEEEE